MRCQKCGYNSFDYNDNCPKCGKSVTQVRELLNLLAAEPQPRPFLESALGGIPEHVPGVEPVEEEFEFSAEEASTEDLADYEGEPSIGGAEEEGVEISLEPEEDEIEFEIEEPEAEEPDEIEMISMEDDEPGIEMAMDDGLEMIEEEPEADLDIAMTEMEELTPEEDEDIELPTLEGLEPEEEDLAVAMPDEDELPTLEAIEPEEDDLLVMAPDEDELPTLEGVGPVDEEETLPEMGLDGDELPTLEAFGPEDDTPIFAPVQTELEEEEPTLGGLDPDEDELTVEDTLPELDELTPEIEEEEPLLGEDTLQIETKAPEPEQEDTLPDEEDQLAGPLETEPILELPEEHPDLLATELEDPEPELELAPDEGGLFDLESTMVLEQEDGGLPPDTIDEQPGLEAEPEAPEEDFELDMGDLDLGMDSTEEKKPAKPKPPDLDSEIEGLELELEDFTLEDV